MKFRQKGWGRKVSKGHDWITYKGSNYVNIVAFCEGRSCHGPKCKNCGYGFCKHCNNEPVYPCPE